MAFIAIHYRFTNLIQKINILFVTGILHISDQ